MATIGTLQTPLRNLYDNSSIQMTKHSDRGNSIVTFLQWTRIVNRREPLQASLRWPNTVFAHAFADVIQRVHKDCKNKHVINRAIILFIQNPHYLRYFSLLLNAVY